MDSPKGTVGLRELAIIDAAIAMCRASQGKEQLDPLASKGLVAANFIVVPTWIIQHVEGPVKDISSFLAEPAHFGNFDSTASLKTIIVERNKMAAAYGEAPRAE